MKVAKPSRRTRINTTNLSRISNRSRLKLRRKWERSASKSKNFPIKSLTCVRKRPNLAAKSPNTRRSCACLSVTSSSWICWPSLPTLRRRSRSRACATSPNNQLRRTLRLWRRWHLSPRRAAWMPNLAKLWIKRLVLATKLSHVISRPKLQKSSSDWPMAQMT